MSEATPPQPADPTAPSAGPVRGAGPEPGLAAPTEDGARLRTGADPTPTRDAHPVDPAPAQDDTPSHANSTHAGLRYAFLRLALVLGVGAVLYVLGMRGPIWLVVTVVLASLIAAFGFRSQRREAGAEMEAAVVARRSREVTTTVDPAPPQDTDAAPGSGGDDARELAAPPVADERERPGSPPDQR